MRAPSLLFCAILVAPPLWGQRLSGEGTCADPDEFHQIPAGDRPDHTFAVSKSRCTWSKPFEIAGQRAVGGTVVQTRERNGNQERFPGPLHRCHVWR